MDGVIIQGNILSGLGIDCGSVPWGVWICLSV